MNIGNDSRDFVLHAHIIKLVNLSSSNMVANSQQFGDRHETTIRRVNKVGIYSNTQQQLATLTGLVQTMAMRDNLPSPCGVCSMVGHMIDMCPSLQEGVVMSKLML